MVFVLQTGKKRHTLHFNHSHEMLKKMKWQNDEFIFIFDTDAYTERLNNVIIVFFFVVSFCPHLGAHVRKEKGNWRFYAF